MNNNDGNKNYKKDNSKKERLDTVLTGVGELGSPLRDYPLSIKDFDKCSITWDDVKKECLLEVTFKEERNIVQSLIHEVAKNSVCTCGSTLELKDFHFEKLSNSIYAFSGTYQCSKCKRSTSILNSIKETIKKLKIKVNLFGIDLNYDGNDLT